MTRKVVFLGAGLGLFTLFALTPEIRRDAHFVDLLEYFSLEGVLLVMYLIIVIRLTLEVAKQFFK